MLTIARLYTNESQARAAAAALVEAGYDANDVAMLSTTTPMAPVSQTASDAEASATAEVAASSEPAPDLLASGVRMGRMLGDHSDFYLSRLTNGRSLVVITPPFIASRAAEVILDSFDPLPESHEPPRKPFVPISEQSTPFSNMLGLPALTEGTPFSDLLGFGFKEEGLSHVSRVFSPLKSDWTFSSMLGMKPATHNPTPFSSMLGLPIKSKRGEGNSGPQLSKKATPFSSMLGLPLLSKRQHFLTS